MARKPNVNYWTTVGSWTDEQGELHKGAFACRIDGKLEILAEGPDDSPQGPVYLEALKRFRDVLARKNVNHAKDANPIKTILETYLDHAAKRLEPSTLRIRRDNFARFLEYRWPGCKRSVAVPDMVIGELTHQCIYDFLAHMEQPREVQLQFKGKQFTRVVSWGPGGHSVFLLSIQAALNWAVKSGIISRNPLVGIDTPPADSRGQDALVGENAAEIEANHKRILAHAPRGYREFFQVLKDTGARPGEIAAATAKDFNAEAGAFIFPKQIRRRNDRFAHKNAKKGKDRIIFLAGKSLEIVKRLVLQMPTGTLFRSHRFNEPLRENHWSKVFDRLQDQLNMPNLTAYSYRHTFATEMLKAGMDIETLADLMGNSAQIIRKHYSHLLADKKSLRAKLEAARGTILAAASSVGPASSSGPVAPPEVS